MLNKLTFCSSKNPETNVSDILSIKKTVFSIDNNRTFLNNSLPITTEQQISIFFISEGSCDTEA